MNRPSAYFLDTCVPIYAAGRAHPYKEPCARIVLAVAEGEIEAVTDAEVIQEIVYRFHAIGRRSEGLKVAEEFLTLLENVLPTTREDVARSLELQRAYPFLPPRDALHVAVILGAGLGQIVSADRHFDRVREVKRVDPMRLQWRTA
jgi:hypothetical protein